MDWRFRPSGKAGPCCELMYWNPDERGQPNVPGIHSDLVYPIPGMGRYTSADRRSPGPFPESAPTTWIAARASLLFAIPRPIAYTTPIHNS